MFGMLNQLSEQQKGGLLMTSGLILLLHTLGIIETGLNYIIIGGSVVMMISGFNKADGIKKINALFKKRQQQ